MYCKKPIGKKEAVAFLDLHIEMYYTSATIPDAYCLGFYPFHQQCAQKADRALVSA
jgi:hypothetical protein